jgi:hypothetical protein
MLTIQIHNLGTGTQTAAEYEYGIWINNKCIKRCTFSGHNRNDGWAILLKQIAEQEIAKKDYT